MPHDIFKRPQAVRDIEECFVYIAENNLDKAVYFLVAVEETLEQIAVFPLIGKQRGFADVRFQNIRMWRVKDFENYLIFYLTASDRVEVVRILQAARDIEDLFS